MTCSQRFEVQQHASGLICVAAGLRLQPSLPHSLKLLRLTVIRGWISYGTSKRFRSTTPTSRTAVCRTFLAQPLLFWTQSSKRV
jgi:hypothetical protein